MRISRNQLIAGMDAFKAREYIRELYDLQTGSLGQVSMENIYHLYRWKAERTKVRIQEMHCDAYEWPEINAVEVIAPSKNSVRRLVQAFEAEGYVEGVGRNRQGILWRTTIKGNALAIARKSTVKRGTATRLLFEIIDRAESINCDPDLLLWVTKMVVFGSYLDPNVNLLGDLDVHVELEWRIQDAQLLHKMSSERVSKSDRRFDNFSQEVFWPRTEVLRRLRGRSTAISLHSDSDLSSLTDRIEAVFMFDPATCVGQKIERRGDHKILGTPSINPRILEIQQHLANLKQSYTAGPTGR